MKSYLHACPFSGVAGLIVLLVIHQDWIIPNWFILPFGLVIAVLGGLAASFAFGRSTWSWNQQAGWLVHREPRSV